MLLSICVPTYNRAAELGRQLQWLRRETKGLGDAVEIIVSDNCSEDDTPAVIAEHSDRFDVTFRPQRHAANIGWMRNFVSCYGAARGRYTWIIGDDDKVDDGAVAAVVDMLRRDPETSLLYLNFYGRVADTGEIVGEHWFDPELSDLDPTDGLEIFQRAIEGHFGAVIFISSTVIRTDLALEGIDEWPACLDNWGGMAFWCAFSALKGHVYVTRETFVECTLGQSYWQKDPMAWFRIRHRDIPQVYRRMLRIGYQRGFCARKIGKLAQEDLVGEEAPQNRRAFGQALLRRPIWAAGVVASYVGSLVAVIVGL